MKCPICGAKTDNMVEHAKQHLTGEIKKQESHSHQVKAKKAKKGK